MFLLRVDLQFYKARLPGESGISANARSLLRIIGVESSFSSSEKSQISKRTAIQDPSSCSSRAARWFVFSSNES